MIYINKKIERNYDVFDYEYILKVLMKKSQNLKYFSLFCTYNHFYLASDKYNLIIKCDKDNLNIVDKFCLPKESRGTSHLVGDILEIKDEIVIIPRNAKTIWMIKDNEFSEIDLHNYFDYDCSHKFLSTIYYNHHIYLLGHYHAGIIGIDLKNMAVDFEYTFPRQFIEIREKKRDAYIARQIYISDYIAYLPFLSANYIAMFNLSDKTINFIKIGNCETGLSGITKDTDGKGFWISRRDSNGLIWWNGLNASKEFSTPEFDKVNNLGVCDLGSKLLLPNFANVSYIFDKKNNCWQKDNINCYGMLEREGKYYILNNNSITMTNHGIDKKRELFVKEDFILDTRILFNDDLNIGLINEDELFDLKDFIYMF